MDRVVTIPNLISLVRLLCVPWFLWLVFGEDELLTAACLLGALGATDWIDGRVARRFNQVSTVGKVLDPAVDRVLLVMAGVTLLIIDAMPLWFGLVVLVRELLIAIGGIYIGLRGHTRLDVQWAGKVAAFALMFSLPFFLSAKSGVWWSTEALVMAWFCGSVGLAYSWYSAFDYLRRARAARRSGSSR